MGEWATPKAGVREREMDAERGGNELDTPCDSLRHVQPLHSAAHPSEEETRRRLAYVNLQHVIPQLP